MENKLAEYRAKKANKNVVANSNNGDDGNLLSMSSGNIGTKIWSNDPPQENQIACYGTIGKIFANLYSLNFLLKFGLWFTLWMFFINMEFGAVYFVTSLTFIMYFSMKCNQNNGNKLSAYSVFNKNFEKLDGTFTAEQFENQMIYGGANRR